MGKLRRPTGCLVLLVSILAALHAIAPARALAAHQQLSMVEDDVAVTQNPPATITKLHLLGVNIVRLALRWSTLAPNPASSRRPRGFRGDAARDYASSRWAPYDRVIQQLAAAGIQVDLDIEGTAPIWADGPGDPRTHKMGNWDPQAKLYAAFVRAVGQRYSGNYDPTTNSVSPGDPNDLPRVTFWTIWNEPDYGPSLAPQGVPGNPTVEDSPRIYRGLVDAAWSSLHATGHGHDTIVFGEVAPRGKSYWGLFDGMTPVRFLRALYCVDSNYRPLTGSAAALRGCPTTAAGSRRFRAQNPALFWASGFSVHPYMRWYQPNDEVNPDPYTHLHTNEYASLGVIGNLTGALDRLNRVYGSHTRLPIYNTEYGYITSPPKHATAKTPYLAPATAAYYMNWSEYISWRNPRLQSFNQYELADPVPPTPTNDWGGFASGLLTFHEVPKLTYYAFRLPLYLPTTTAHRGQRLEIWGCIRAGRFALIDTGLPQQAMLQFQANNRGPYTTVMPITITDPNNCYFDIRVPATVSGTFRLTYTYPTTDPDLPAGYTIYSRHVQVTVH